MNSKTTAAPCSSLCSTRHDKLPLGIDVLTAARQRIAWTFDNFERLYVSFSGGKDSTVMLHLVAEEARLRRTHIGLLFVDLEAQYKLTIEHIQECFTMYRDVCEPYWIALPLRLRNAVSCYEPRWTCWDSSCPDDWVRGFPDGAITDCKALPFFETGMEFEEFVPRFGTWFGNGRTTACFVGIRADESLNRWRTIKQQTKMMRDGKRFTTLVDDNLFNVYPVYDWKTEDLWTFHSRHPELPHNRLYDRMHQAGLKPSQMRICQPYGDDQRRGLWLYHVIEPQTWGRVVARVNGANGGALYCKSTGNIMGYGKITCPEGHNWESFAGLLINTMPPDLKFHYECKIEQFLSWWFVKDGGRAYAYGGYHRIPDEADPKLESAGKVPSWRRICKVLLRNDYWCKGLSFAQTKSHAYQRYIKMKKKRQEERSEEWKRTMAWAEQQTR